MSAMLRYVSVELPDVITAVAFANMQMAPQGVRLLTIIPTSEGGVTAVFEKEAED